MWGFSKNPHTHPKRILWGRGAFWDSVGVFQKPPHSSKEDLLGQGTVLGQCVGPLGGAASPLPSRTLLGCDIDMFRILEELSQPGPSASAGLFSRSTSLSATAVTVCSSWGTFSHGLPILYLEVSLFPQDLNVWCGLCAVHLRRQKGLDHHRAPHYVPHWIPPLGLAAVFRARARCFIELAVSDTLCTS